MDFQISLYGKGTSMNVTIVGMIYKSTQWLAVMNHYMLSDKSKSSKHNVDYVVIALFLYSLFFCKYYSSYYSIIANILSFVC